MDEASQSKPAPQEWRDALRLARAEVAAGQTVESEAIFAEIAADLDGMEIPAMNEIPLRDAKATLSAVIDRVRQGEPTIITRLGKPAAVIVSFEEWERLSRVPSFGRLLMAAPIGPDDLPERD